MQELTGSASVATGSSPACKGTQGGIRCALSPLALAGRLLQHARGRQQTQLILALTAAPAAPAARARLASAMTAFVAMYEPHEAREDTVIHPAFRATVSAEEIVQLGAHVADLQRQRFGPHGFTGMLGRVDRIEQTLGIYDLAQFTPPDLAAPT